MKNWYEDIKKYVEAEFWTAEMVQNAVVKDKISQEQANTLCKLMSAEK